MNRRRAGKSRAWRIRTTLLGLLLCGVLSAAQVLTDAAGNSLTERIDYLLFDLRYQLLPVQRDQQRHRIVIVDIDEASLQQEGRWPWSRFKVASLLDKLADAGVVVVGFDVVFSEPERNVAEELLQGLGGRPGQDHLRSSIVAVREEFDADAALAAQLPQVDTVLGWYLHAQQTNAVGGQPPPLAELDPDQRSGLPAMQGYTAPLPALAEAAAGLGFVTSEPDADGVIRRSPLLMRYGNALYGALSLEMARAYLLLPEVRVDWERIADRKLPAELYLTDRPIRLDHRGRVVVPFRGGRGMFPYIPATDVLRGRVDPELLFNTLVLVGTSSVGLGDLRATPLDRSYPGVEVHATMLDAMLNGGFPYRPDWAPGATLALLLVLGVLASLLLPLLGPFWQSVVGVGLVGGLVGLNYYLWHALGLDLPLAAPLLLVLAVIVVNLISGFLNENLQRRSMKLIFDQYVPPQHIDEMLDNPEAAESMAGESRDMTVLFADVRDFTTISEAMSAAALKDLLNRYLTPVTGVIFEHGGTIDKYIGDMVVAFWGAPVENPAHADSAVACALEMLAATRALNQEFADQGYPSLAIGIGLNSGMMNVGDMGSQYRRAYTVLGDAVNLAARLESLTRLYQVDLIVGEATRRAASGFVYRQLDRVRVKGKQETVEIYQPLAREGALSEADALRLELHGPALQAYLDGRWDDARSGFRQLLSRCPADAGLCELFLGRIDEVENTYRDDWDGVYRLLRK